MLRLPFAAFAFAFALAVGLVAGMEPPSPEAPVTAACKKHVQCTTARGNGYCWRATCFPFIRLPPSVTIDTIKRQVNAAALSRAERVKILSVMAEVIEDTNVHLFLYRNLYGFDPVSDLARLKALQTDEEASTYAFHQNVSRTFRKMNDFHTLYTPPAPLNFLTGLLGFTLDRYYDGAGDDDNPHFIVTDMVPGFEFSKPSFKRGVQVTHIDGVPVHQAAIRAGRAGYASNTAATLSFGTDVLAARIGLIADLPEERTAVIRYVTNGDHKRSIRIPWQFVAVSDNETAIADAMQDQSVPEATRASERLQSISRADREPQVLPTTLGGLSTTPAIRAATSKEGPIPVVKEFENFFSASILSTKKGDIGVLTLPNFGLQASEALVAEFTRLLNKMPSRGLIIDIRGNQGGFADYPAALTELISNKKLPSLPMQFRTSRILTAIANFENLPVLIRRLVDVFSAALRHAVRIGEPLTPPVGNLLKFGAAAIPFPTQTQVYFGPVVTLTDARTYSAGDIFTLLQKDVGTSLVVGVDNTTGAGGAGAFGYSDIAVFFPAFGKLAGGGIDFSFAAFRFHRTGDRSGAQVEHFGVTPDIRYYRTRKDLLEDDEDLFNFLASKLVSRG